MAITILNQTIIMLILMAVGAVCSKTGMISENTNKDLSRFVLQIVNPVVIFMSYQTENNAKLVHNLLLTFALSAGAFAVMIALSYILIRHKDGRDTAVERFSAVYSNCGFMGIPLVNALYGMEGVFYLTAFITTFNIIAWTHGIIMISGEKDFKKAVKVFYSPTMISIMLGLITFFIQFKLPSIPAKALGYITELNTPLAMLVSGVTIAGTDPLKILRKKRVYYVCFLRLLLIPAILSLILAFIPADEKVRMTVIVAASAPPAAMCTLQCIRYGKNSLYASEIFTFGTILSIATLPLVAAINERLTNILH